MIGIKVDNMRGLFFDRKVVRDATDRSTRRVLSRFGAFVRTRARSSIRRRKRSAAAGRPPSSHTGLLKRWLFFAYEPQRRGVVIGPARLNAVIGNAPEALEYGGRSKVASGTRRRRRVRTVSIAPHPYMGPALQAERPKLPAMWANSVKP